MLNDSKGMVNDSEGMVIDSGEMVNDSNDIGYVGMIHQKSELISPHGT